MSGLTSSSIAALIDHTLLKPEATAEQINQLCDEAAEYHFAAVCINPRWIPLAAERLSTTQVKIATVCGFPLGADTTQSKVAQAHEAMFAGADEIDVVADLSAILTQDDAYLGKQLSSLLKTCQAMRPAVTLKVILETAALTEEQMIWAARLASQVGVDFVKTSTGFHPAGGGTVEAVRLLKENAIGCQVKAAGGIRTLSQMQAMVEAGADRIGASAGVAIMQELSNSEA